MRLFISIDFPQEVINYISLLQKQLENQNLFEGKLVNPEQLHLTLQFIGDVPEEKIPEIQKMLQSISMKPFEVCLETLGVFPSEDHIRIIWVDVKAKELKTLAEKIHTTLDTLVDLEDRDFVSHVTIARVKKVFDKEKLISYLKSVEVEPICFTVNNFMLKQSILSSHGAEYNDVEQYTLEVY